MDAADVAGFFHDPHINPSGDQYALWAPTGAAPTAPSAKVGDKVKPGDLTLNPPAHAAHADEPTPELPVGAPLNSPADYDKLPAGAVVEWGDGKWLKQPDGTWLAAKHDGTPYVGNLKTTTTAADLGSAPGGFVQSLPSAEFGVGDFDTNAKLKPASSDATLGSVAQSGGGYVQLKKGGAKWAVVGKSDDGMVTLAKPGQKGSAQEGKLVTQKVPASTVPHATKAAGTVKGGPPKAKSISIPATDKDEVRAHLDALPVGAQIGAKPGQVSPWVKQPDGTWTRTSSYGTKNRSSAKLAAMYAASENSPVIYGQGDTMFDVPSSAAPAGPPKGAAVNYQGNPYVVTGVSPSGSAVSLTSMTSPGSGVTAQTSEVEPWNSDEPAANTGGVKVGALKPGDLLTLKSGGVGRVAGPGTGENAGKVEVTPLDGSQTRYVPPSAVPDKVLLREFYDAKSHQDWAASQKTGGGGGGAGGSVSAGDRAATSPASYSPASDRLDHLQDAAHDSFAGMTQKSRDTLKSYSHSGFGEINHAARDSKVKMTAAQHAKLAALDKAIAEAKPLDENLILFRGWGGESGKEAAKSQVGEVIFDHGIMSTSLHDSFMAGARGYGGGGSGVGLQIEVPAGAQALWVGDNVAGGMTEAEVLLPRHSEFVVLGRFKTSKGQSGLRVRLLLPGEDPEEVLKAAQADADAAPGYTAKNKGAR